MFANTFPSNDACPRDRRGRSSATRAHVARIPMGRMGQPEDIAGAVGYFMSEEAGFITGQHLFVCGGLSVGSPLV